jgi:hypothetical protein
MRSSLLKDRTDLKPEAAAELDALIARMTRVRTARAWAYKEQLREILERKPINVVRATLQRWYTCVMRSKVEPMKGPPSYVATSKASSLGRRPTRPTDSSKHSTACSKPPSAVRVASPAWTRSRCHLPDRRQARPPRGQPSRPATHLKFNRA